MKLYELTRGDWFYLDLGEASAPHEIYHHEKIDGAYSINQDINGNTIYLQAYTPVKKVVP